MEVTDAQLEYCVMRAGKFLVYLDKCLAWPEAS